MASQKELVVQFLFNYAKSEDTARTIQEISDQTGVAIPTVYRILNPKTRPAGIVIASNGRKTNTNRAVQYWYSIDVVNAAALEFEIAKQQNGVQMPIPNNSMTITPRDLAALYLPANFKEPFENYMENMVDDDMEFCIALQERCQQLIDMEDMDSDRRWRNIIMTGLAMAQKGIDRETH